MYEKFFGLKRRPFAAMPDPGCWYHCDRYQAVLDELLVCAEQGQGIGVVIASAGLGKTLLCERLVRDIGEPFTSVLLRHATFQNRREFLQTVLCELAQPYDLPTDQELRLALTQLLRELGQQGRALLLVIDEAHLINEKILEELRILADQSIEGTPLVRLILCGQLSLEDKLAHPQLQALNQRIRSHITVPPLTRAESADYIDFRITWAGGRTSELFQPETVKAICRASDGNPRCINQLCDHLLLLAYVAEQRPVPIEMVYDALDDLKQLPLAWHSLETSEPRYFEAPSPSGAETDTAIEVGGEKGAVEAVEFEPSWRIEPPAVPPAASPIADISSQADIPDVLKSQEQHSPEDMTEDMADSSPELPESPAELPDEGWTEELVIDRYNALDAGLEPFEVPPPAFEETSSDPRHGHAEPIDDVIDIFERSAEDLLKMPGSIDSRMQIIQQILDYVTDDMIDVASSRGEDLGQSPPEARPQVTIEFLSAPEEHRIPEELGTIDQTVVDASSDAAAEARFQEIPESHRDSIEELNEAGHDFDAGYDLPSHLNEMLPPAANIGGESPRAKIAAVSKPQDTTAATVIEIGADCPPPELEKAASTHKPIRNLFTLLRRKQQGRL